MAQGLQFSLGLRAEPGEVGFSYRFAGAEVVTDHPLAVPQEARPGDFVRSPAPTPTPRAGRLVFVENACWLAGRKRRVTAWWDGPLGWIEVEPRITLALDLERRGAQLLSLEATSEQEITELALGPLLLPLLASAGTLVLHASAARIEGRLLAFVGNSGAGKSTLVGSRRNGWELLADDLLPVRRAGAGLRALPDYPQLKLGGVLPGGGEQPLAALVVLAGPGSADEVRLRPLFPKEVVGTLLRHCAAASLFGRQLRKTHFEFATALAPSLPAFELTYPRDLTRLPELDLVLTDLARQLPAEAV